MPFQPGESGNPAGRPPGSRNKVNRAMEPVFQANGEAVIERLVEHAKAANPVAMRLCLDRLVPLGKYRQVGFQLPPMRKADDVRAAVATIHTALGDGDISSGEAVDLLRVAEISARMLREADNDHINALIARDRQIAEYEAFLRFGSDSPLDPAEENEAAAEGAPAIVNNNAETMADPVSVPAETDAAPELGTEARTASADARSESGPAIVNNNAETIAAAEAPPRERLDLVGNNENVPDARDEVSPEPLLAASG